MSQIPTRRVTGASALAKLLSDAKKTEKKFAKDERFWKLDTDKAGNGRAVIRFIPDPNGDFLVQKWSHSVQGPGGYYIENCLTTLGQNCPCCEINNELWNTGVEANKNIARQRKRKLQYISNIVVVKDPAHPENNGKVFLYEYGQKIFDMIMRLAEPEFEDEEPINAFDVEKGASFNLIAKKEDGFRNYNASKFNTPSPLFDGDEQKIEAALASVHAVAPLVAPDQFKAYDVLKKKLDEVLAGRGKAAGVPSAASASRPSVMDAPVRTAKSAAPAPVVEEDVDDSTLTSDDSDDPSKYFQDLADE